MLPWKKVGLHHVQSFYSYPINYVVIDNCCKSESFVLDLFTHRDLTKAKKIYPKKYMQNLEYCKLFIFLGNISILIVLYFCAVFWFGLQHLVDILSFIDKK